MQTNKKLEDKNNLLSKVPHAFQSNENNQTEIFSSTKLIIRSTSMASQTFHVQATMKPNTCSMTTTTSAWQTLCTNSENDEVKEVLTSRLNPTKSDPSSLATLNHIQDSTTLDPTSSMEHTTFDSTISMHTTTLEPDNNMDYTTLDPSCSMDNITLDLTRNLDLSLSSNIKIKTRQCATV